MMGAGVGLTIGFIFGSWTILRYVFPLSSLSLFPVCFSHLKGVLAKAYLSFVCSLTLAMRLCVAEEQVQGVLYQLYRNTCLAVQQRSHSSSPLAP